MSYANILLFAVPTDQIEPHPFIWMQELLQTAEARFEATMNQQSLGDEACQACTSLLQARILQARGEIESARKVLVELQARRLHLLPYIEPAILREQARLSRVLGDLAAAQIWATERYQRLPEDLVRAHSEKAW